VKFKRLFQPPLWKIIACLLSSSVAIGLSIGYYWWNSFRIPLSNATAVQLVIPKKTRLEKVALLLEQNGVVPSAFQFHWVVRLKKMTNQVKAGEYLFPAERSPASVLQQLREGKTVQHFITFPEGLTSTSIVALLKAAPFLEGEITSIPPEGTLLPETYAYSYGEQRQYIIERMQDALQENLGRIWQARQNDLPFKTPQEALTLASIVEKETAIAEERPRIAAVFMNRLKLGMPLQSDPTVIYALEQLYGQPLTRPLTTADLKTPYPYNTYQIAALPPGPICNPGLASLRAVMHPAHTKELFFVADGSGGHTFSETLQQHQQQHQNWRRIRKSLRNKVNH
jgi:UPF0755 protein